MTVSELIDILVEDCGPDDLIYVDYLGCVYEVVDARTSNGEVIFDAI